jgi:hypothetical protein
MSDIGKKFNPISDIISDFTTFSPVIPLLGLVRYHSSRMLEGVPSYLITHTLADTHILVHVLINSSAAYHTYISTVSLSCSFNHPPQTIFRNQRKKRKMSSFLIVKITGFMECLTRDKKVAPRHPREEFLEAFMKTAFCLTFCDLSFIL